MTSKHEHEHNEEQNQQGEPAETPDSRAAREAAAASDTQAYSKEDIDAMVADAEDYVASEPQSEADDANAEVDPHLALAEERLNDLKRLQAEYQNYRNRVKRDEQLVQELAMVSVLRELVPILDDIDRVEAAGDLEGSPLELVAIKFRGTLEKMGLEKFGTVGDDFDPNLHEAIAKLPAPDAKDETIADVVEVGYMVGDRQLRPAKVAVKVPQE